jgi:pectin methylesterase-like acyl-CoA thioesterase
MHLIVRIGLVLAACCVSAPNAISKAISATSTSPVLASEEPLSQLASYCLPSFQRPVQNRHAPSLRSATCQKINIWLAQNTTSGLAQSEAIRGQIRSGPAETEGARGQIRPNVTVDQYKEWRAIGFSSALPQEAGDGKRTYTPPPQPQSQVQPQMKATPAEIKRK